MSLTVSLPLQHSWPLPEPGQRFDLGRLFGTDSFDGVDFADLDGARLAAQGIGLWSCDLADNRLTWTDPVFDIFGLPRGAILSREDVASLYYEGSRAAMEHLRAYAIRHRRGFTIDAKVRTIGGDPRWMRLLAAPVCERNRVVRLQGLKQDVTHAYC